MNKTPPDLGVARTILRQLGGRQFIAMTGSKNFIGSDTSLTFRIGTATKNKANRCCITLTPMDLYRVEFSRITNKRGHGPELKSKGTFDAIYFDALTALFTRETGFAVKLF